MSGKGKKAAATAALLGEPIDASSSSAPKKKTKGVKKELDAGVQLEKRLVSLLSGQERGMSQDEVCEGLACAPSDLVDVINSLLNKHRIELLQDGSGKIFYKLISADKVEKLRGLLAPEILIYQLIEKSGNLGIWIKDLRRKSNLSALEIPKILKELIKRKLIKCEKSVAATNKKVYMLYEIEPAREVSGGAWYDKSTGEFDTEYMAALENAILMLLEKKQSKRESERERVNRGMMSPTGATETGSASAQEVEHFLRETGAFKTVPSEEEVGKILNGLWLEGRVERQSDEDAFWRREEAAEKKRRTASGVVSSSSSTKEEGSGSQLLIGRKRRAPGALGDEEDAVFVYRFIKGGAFDTPLATIPCAACPVARNCCEGNPISPQTCEYLTQWLQF